MDRVVARLSRANTIQPPRRALVLAAGLGKRLRPLTNKCPKPLLPLWSVPMLERVLQLLESWGVEEIAINIHWQPERMRVFLAQREGRARIVNSFEPELLGTGGALRPLRGFFGDEPFWVVNADIAIKVNPEPLLTAFAGGDGLGAAWLEPTRGPRTVEADRKGRITCYRSPTPGVSGTYTFCGLQLLSPDIFAYLPDQPFSTLVDAYENALQESRFMQGVVVKKSAWDDAGTIAAYLRLHGTRECRRWGVDSPPENGLWVGAEAEVAAGTRGSRSVVCGSARVLPGSALRNCVIAGGAFVGKLDNVVCVAATEVEDDALLPLLQALQWSARDTGVQSLGTRGSNRSFWRLFHHHATAIYIRYSHERAENQHYGAHARLLKAAGVPVPTLLAELPERCCLALEDWGRNSLQERMTANPDAALLWYKRIVEALAHLHTEGTQYVLESSTCLEPPFTSELYAWERGLFLEHLLCGRFGIDKWPQGVERELLTVAAELAVSQQALLHRDFQSSNILMRGNRFAFIDFQGMRMGAPAYDLASLLYDPYVKLEPPLREELADAYCRGRSELVPARGLLHFGATQRLIQALGAFGRLASVGQRGFTRYIMPALENLLCAADECNLDALGALVEDLIAMEARVAIYGQQE